MQWQQSAEWAMGTHVAAKQTAKFDFVPFQLLELWTLKMNVQRASKARV